MNHQPLKPLIADRKYMSAVVINKIISLMGNTVLGIILQQIKQWYGISIDEATDVSKRTT